MSKRAYAIAITLTAILVLAPGCAAFRAGNLAPLSPWPPSGGQKKSARLAVSFEYTFNGSQLEGAAVLLDKFAEQTVSIYVESGLFSEVRRGGGSADIMADVKIVRAEEGSLGMAVLTGLTLYLVPSKSTVTTTVKTSFRDVDGNTLGTFEKSEAVNVWQQLFLVFWEPFYFPTPVMWGAFDDVQRATLAEAHARGIL